jgi:hypothetical protein
MTTQAKKQNRFSLFHKKQTVDATPVDNKPETPEAKEVVETVEVLEDKPEAIAVEATEEAPAAVEKTAGIFGTLFKRKTAKKVCFIY